MEELLLIFSKILTTVWWLCEADTETCSTASNSSLWISIQDSFMSLPNSEELEEELLSCGNVLSDSGSAKFMSNAEELLTLYSSRLIWVKNQVGSEGVEDRPRHSMLAEEESMELGEDTELSSTAYGFLPQHD
jgi:hypothetical protein